MGGIGSGRHWHDVKNITSDYLSIDVRKWQRGDLLKPGTIFECRWNEIEKNIQVTTESDKVILNYRYRIEGENWKDIKYAVQLDWTPCNFGGKRAWFLCPAIGCGKRVAILYGDPIFACRHCYKLAYRCQRKAPYDRAAMQAHKIREKLNWNQDDISDYYGWEKPKGMHWKTFLRLKDRHDQLNKESAPKIAKRFDISYWC
uniref:Uncharacterized protein n=1 Tax=Candidatus Kentrum sp. TUN TaxID=2126343 RepID=A0A450ZK28_9GAMM|nr:MAG: hypothetical protein BECKTUN1418D_GA0071000_10205 [Candidatus Kentron sp. TUN]